MTPHPLFFSQRTRLRNPGSRVGVSELYASLLMIAVTLTFGSFVTAAAVTQYSLATNSSTLGSALRESSAGKQISLVYAAVTPSGSCPLYKGAGEGTSFSVALYNYGSAPFTPVEFLDNSTLYTGSFATLSPAGFASYTIALGACAHSSGQTFLAADAYGEVIQFAT